jgi:hypothetical protein
MPPLQNKSHIPGKYIQSPTIVLAQLILPDKIRERPTRPPTRFHLESHTATFSVHSSISSTHAIADTETATFADDTAVLAAHADPVIATHRLQAALFELQKWLQKWRMKANETKSTHVTFTLKRLTCTSVQQNSTYLVQPADVKHLVIHLDRRLTWRKHITTKRKQLDLQLRKLYWILGRKSHLSLEKKLLVYKAILKPIWTYGVQLWGTASNSNIDILERFQSKDLRIITDAPWYVPNTMIRRDLRFLPVRQEVKTTASPIATGSTTTPTAC